MLLSTPPSMKFPLSRCSFFAHVKTAADRNAQNLYLTSTFLPESQNATFPCGKSSHLRHMFSVLKNPTSMTTSAEFNDRRPYEANAAIRDTCRVLSAARSCILSLQTRGFAIHPTSFYAQFYNSAFCSLAKMHAFARSSLLVTYFMTIIVIKGHSCALLLCRTT